MDETIRSRVRVAAPIEEVWAAVSTPEGLATWLGSTSVELDARPRGTVHVRWPDGSSSRGLVEEVLPPRRLVFRWHRLREGRFPTGIGAATRVAIDLEADGDATEVSVAESPWLAAALEDVS